MSAEADDYQDIDLALADAEMAPPTFAGEPTERKHRHDWSRIGGPPDEPWDGNVYYVCKCGKTRDEIQARRGKTSRNYGNRAELKVARKYGGDKIGHAGGPVDVRGKEWNVQVKTHRRLPPLEWRKAFQAMGEKRERMPKLLIRYLPGPGLPPDDYFVIPGNVWLEWFGRDED